MIIPRQRAFSEIEQKEFNSRAQKLLRKRLVDLDLAGPSAAREINRSLSYNPVNVNQSINLKAVHPSITSGSNATKSSILSGRSGLKVLKKGATEKQTKDIVNEYDHGFTKDMKKRTEEAKKIMKLHKHFKGV